VCVCVLLVCDGCLTCMCVFEVGGGGERREIERGREGGGIKYERE
jgi:hypothetical protein